MVGPYCFFLSFDVAVNEILSDHRSSLKKGTLKDVLETIDAINDATAEHDLLFSVFRVRKEASYAILSEGTTNRLVTKMLCFGEMIYTHSHRVTAATKVVNLVFSYDSHQKEIQMGFIKNLSVLAKITTEGTKIKSAAKLCSVYVCHTCLTGYKKKQKYERHVAKCRGGDTFFNFPSDEPATVLTYEKHT